MKYFLLLIIQSLSPIIFAQKTSISQEIHVNKNSTFGVSKLNLHKKNFSGGINLGIGNFGSNNFNSANVFPSYLFFEESYPTFNNFQYDIEDYYISNQGISIGIHAETNWKKEKNSFILGANASIYFIKETLVVTHSFPWGIQKPIEENEFITANYIIYHKNISAGVYLGYQRAINRKISLNILLNMPYYFPLHTDKYYVFGVEYLMVALEPNLSLGVSYIIKK